MSKKIHKNSRKKIIVLLILCVIIIAMAVLISLNKETFKTFSISSKSQKAEAATVIDAKDIQEGSGVNHDCSNFLIWKYENSESGKHWQECTQCGKKYNETAHSFSWNWLAEKYENLAWCSNENKHIGTCLCGYTAVEENDHVDTGDSYSRAHNFTWDDDRVAHNAGGCAPICTNCLIQGEYQKHVNSENTILGCSTNTSGTCIHCRQFINTAHYLRYTYSNIDHTHEESLVCSGCDKNMIDPDSVNVTVQYDSTNHRKATINAEFTLIEPEAGILEGLAASNCTPFAGVNSKVNIIQTPTCTVNGKHVTITNGIIEARKQANSSEERMTNRDIEWIQIVTVNYGTYTASLNVKMFTEDGAPVCTQVTEVKADDAIESADGWRTGSKITISGTEELSDIVKITAQTGDLVLINNEDAQVDVDTGEWSHTFTISTDANLESENGVNVTFTLTDQAGNTSNVSRTLLVKIDKKAPQMTSANATSTEWSKSKNFNFTATEGGVGGVKFALSGDGTSGYVDSTLVSNVYSNEYTFTGDLYGNKTTKVHFKDALDNTASYDFTISNIDNTAPTITSASLNGNQVTITANDEKESLGEGSGVSSYKYILSNEKINMPTIEGNFANSTEVTGKSTGTGTFNVTLGNNNYIYVVAVDKVGNIGNIVELEVSKYTATFNSNGGSTANPTTITITPEQELGTLPTTTRNGYNFDGWFTLPTGGTQINSTTILTEDTTFYAHWTPIEYTITYNLNYGTLSNGITNPPTYTINTDDITLNNPSKTGYIFTGWAGTGIDSNTPQLTVVIPKGSTGNREYTANFVIDDTNTKKLKYTVNYYKDENLQVDDTQVVEKTVQVLQPDTLEVNKDDINISNKYDGYTFERTDPAVIPDTISTNGVINVYYISQASVHIKYIDFNTKEEIATGEIISGVIGKTYETHPKEFEGYKIALRRKILGDNIENPNDDYIPEYASGNLEKEAKIVNYYYFKKGKLVVQYIDITTGNKLTEDTILDQLDQDSYSLEPKQIPDYVVLTKDKDGNNVYPENEQGVINVTKNADNTFNDTTTVTYYYSKERSVEISYRDISSKEKIKDSVVLYGIEGAEYDVSEYKVSINGYTFIEEPKDYKGVYTQEPQEKTFYYSKTATITIKYIDINTGKEIIDKIEISGYDGQEIYIEKYINEKDGYVIKNSPQNTKVKFTEDNQEIILEYVKKTTITVKYINKDSSETISQDVIINGEEGANYDITSLKKDISGYYLIEEPSLTGKYTSENQTLAFYFRKDPELSGTLPKTGKVSGTIVVVIGIAIVAILSTVSIILIKKMQGS